MTHIKIRTAIYARVSTLDQDQAMHPTELHAYINQPRLPTAAEFIDQKSASIADRPVVDTILIRKFDRFAFSTKQLIDALQEFRHLDVEFILITEQVYTFIHNTIIYAQLPSCCKDEKHGKCLRVSMWYRN